MAYVHLPPAKQSEPAVAETGGCESSHASEDASEPLTASQKKRFKKKMRKAQRNAKAQRDLHSPLSVKEKASKAMSGVHTRFREDGGDDDASDSSIEDFSAYGNSLCASPSSFS